MERQLLHFDDFEVDLRAREVRKAGVLLRLQDQPFQILALLLEHAGDIVTREDIQARLWPDGTFVDFEHSVNAAIKRLRTALGDTAENPRFVETLHRRGYRFVGHLNGHAPTPDISTPGLHARRDLTDGRPRLVVLPFTNLSDDPQDYFSDGLTEEMIAQVGRRCANRIGVLARTSSMLYKNVTQGAGEIGEALRAEYLVEGSVRREGDRVRITAQLIETKGETHLWAESYDRRLEDCLAVQADVAAQIAHALALELLPAPAIEVAGTRHAGAYQAFLHGRFFWNKPGESGLARAVGFYDEALALDSSFGAAYSSRARARISQCEYHRVLPRSVLPLVRADARRALEIDPSDAHAHVALAEVARMLDWDGAAAEASYRDALTANPNSEAAHRYYGLFLATRRRQDATRMADRACDLDPLCLVINTSAATVRYLHGDYESAVDRCRDTLAMDPTFGPARRRMASALAALGRFREAIEQFELISPERLDPVSRAWMGHALAASGNRAAARAVATALKTAVDGQRVPPYYLALLYSELGDIDLAFGELARACEERDALLDTVGVEPGFRRLHGDGRFGDVLARLGLTG